MSKKKPKKKLNIDNEIELKNLVGSLTQLVSLIENRWTITDEDNWEEKLSSLAANYVQLCGMLAGFSGAFILALLSPGLFPQGTSEISIIILLFTSFGYTYAAAWSAIAPTLPLDIGWKRLKLSDTFFLVSNIFLWIAFTIILFSLAYIWAFVASLVLLVFAIVITFFFGLQMQAG